MCNRFRRIGVISWILKLSSCPSGCITLNASRSVIDDLRQRGDKRLGSWSTCPIASYMPSVHFVANNIGLSWH